MIMFPVVILAGGLATRLRPLTITIPKSLVEVNGELFIAHQLRLLKKNGFQRVILCLGYLGDMVEAYVKNGAEFGLEVKYVYDGPQLLGTAGAIKKALPQLSDNFFVLYGDSYLTCDYAAVQQFYTASKKPALMTVFHNQGQWDKSNVEFDGTIKAYDKKNITPRMQYIDYGLGIFNHQVFELVPDNEVYDLAVLYQTLLNQQRLVAYEVTNRFYEVGSFAGIDELGYYLRHDCITTT